MTVKELKNWLEKQPDDMRVTLMVETKVEGFYSEPTRVQFDDIDITDLATAKHRVVLIHEPLLRAVKS